MYKEDLLHEIDKLENELNVSDKKTYIIYSRTKRLIIFLRQFNNDKKNDNLAEMIEKLDLCDKSGGYGGGIFDKQQYLILLKKIKEILKEN